MSMTRLFIKWRLYDNEEMIILQDVVRARWYFNPDLKDIVGPTVVVPVLSLTVILETELKPISSFEDSQVVWRGPSAWRRSIESVVRIPYQ